METRKVLTRLRELAQLDVDAIGAYDSAIKHCKPEIGQKLSEFRADHVAHLEALNALISKYGGEPVERSRDLKGTLLKGVTAATSLLGTEAALVATIGSEEVSKYRYRFAARGELPEDVKQALEKHLADEDLHLEWCKEMVFKRIRPQRKAESRP